MAERRLLPVLSTGTAVSFPGAPLTVAVTRAVSMRALDAAMRDDHVVFAVAELNGGEELKPEDPPLLARLRETRERAFGLGKVRGIDEDVLRRVLDSVREIGPFVDLVA